MFFILAGSRPILHPALLPAVIPPSSFAREPFLALCRYLFLSPYPSLFACLLSVMDRLGRVSAFIVLWRLDCALFLHPLFYVLCSPSFLCALRIILLYPTRLRRPVTLYLQSVLCPPLLLYADCLIAVLLSPALAADYRRSSLIVHTIHTRVVFHLYVPLIALTPSCQPAVDSPFCPHLTEGGVFPIMILI